MIIPKYKDFRWSRDADVVMSQEIVEVMYWTDFSWLFELGSHSKFKYKSSTQISHSKFNFKDQLQLPNIIMTPSN